MQRILREVHLWSKLSHENIVRMLGISTEFNYTISIVSHWYEMGDAHAYVQDKENDPRPLVSLIWLQVHSLFMILQLMDVASGLHYLHAHPLGPIFHGDLKGVSPITRNCQQLTYA